MTYVVGQRALVYLPSTVVHFQVLLTTLIYDTFHLYSCIRSELTLKQYAAVATQSNGGWSLLKLDSTRPTRWSL